MIFRIYLTSDNFNLFKWFPFLAVSDEVSRHLVNGYKSSTNTSIVLVCNYFSFIFKNVLGFVSLEVGLKLSAEDLPCLDCSNRAKYVCWPLPRVELLRATVIVIFINFNMILIDGAQELIDHAMAAAVPVTHSGWRNTATCVLIPFVHWLYKCIS